MIEVSTQDGALPEVVSTDDEPLVSVIIPTYNQSNYLKEAVESVLRQTHTHLECLIVDDGSTDDTRQVSEDFISRDSRVKYFYKQNGGVPSARNFGVERSQGEWLQFLDHDDWLHSDKIRFQLSYAKSKRNDIVFYCDYELVYEQEDKNGIRRKHKPLLLGSLTKEQLLQRFFSIVGIHVACLLCKREFCLETKFNEEISGIDDLKFQVDLLMTGKTFFYTPISGLFHRKHQSNQAGRGDDWTPTLKKHTIRYMEILQEEYGSLRNLCQPGWVSLLKRSIRDSDQVMFDKALKNLQMPVNLDGMKISNKFVIQLLYWLKPYTPSFQALLEFYRSMRKRWYSTPKFLQK